MYCLIASGFTSATQTFSLGALIVTEALAINSLSIGGSLYLGFGRSQCGRSGRDRPFAPWSMLFAGDREKARVVAPTFRSSPNGCRAAALLRSKPVSARPGPHQKKGEAKQ